MKNPLKRGLSLLLALVMLLTLLPVGVLAAEETEETDDYIEVRTIEDLYNIRLDLTANYILMNDIDLTAATASGGAWDYDGRGWNPIGSNDVYGGGVFSGCFDGNGHKIIGMRIYAYYMPSGTASTTYAGLFAYVTGEVRNLAMEDVNITDGCHYTGAVAAYNGGIITNCSVSGVVKSDSYAGGIAAYNGSASIISRCSNTAMVMGRSYTGGITGYNNGSVSRCYNTGDIQDNSNNGDVGGIAGYNYGRIDDGYNTGAISGTDSSGSSGGIAGTNSGSSGKNAVIKNCYNVGGVKRGTYSGYGIAYVSSYSYIANCYYSRGSGSTGATSLTETQMLLSSMYVGFDFQNTWTQNASAIYPYPQLVELPQDLRVIEGIEIASMPAKTNYSYLEALDVSGCQIYLKMETGDKLVTVTPDMVAGYDAAKPGTQTLTISYLGFTTTFAVTVREKVYIPVRTVEDLYNIRSNLSGSYILMNDIDLTAATAKGGDWDFMGNGWNPIGSNDVYGNSAFSGYFDGNGHSITGLRIAVTSLPSGTGEKVYLGLFANVTGTVKDLSITGSISYSNNRNYYIGSVAGVCSGIVKNCVNHAIINGTATELDVSGYVGGIVGSASGAKISGCTNTGSVSSYCVSRMGDAGSNYNNAGGITTSGGTIFECYNIGTVSARATGTSSAYGSSGDAYAAGIAVSGTITDCYNTGEIAATLYSGYGYVMAYGIGGTATRCYNVGSVVRETYSGYSIANSTSTDCYYLAGTGNGNTGATSLTESQMKLQSMYAGFDFESIWTLNPYANHPYPQLQSNVQDLDESASIVSIISWPFKTEYMEGEALDLTGCAMNVTYVSGRTEQMNVTADMVSGFDNTKIGEQILTVTWHGGSDTFPVTVKARPEVTGVELISGPNETEFRVGTAFDFTGAQLRVTYSDGSDELVDVTVDMTSGGNIHHLGKQTVTVSLYGMTATFEVTVTPVAISSLKLETAPHKLTYLEGEELDLTGLVLMAVMNSGAQQQVGSGYTVSGYNGEPGTHTVKISYMGKSVTFDVFVEARTVVGLALKAVPAKTTYVSGEEFDPAGMMIVATYNNGDVEAIEDYEISGFDDVPGIKTIVASYGGKYVAFSVSVISRIITDFRIVSYPAKLDYLQNEPFDTTGLQVEATYNDGSVEKVTDYEVVGFSSNPGTHTISVAYKGWVETFTIHVSARELTDLIVVPPKKLTYYLNEEFDRSGMSVTACYNNGQKVSVNDYAVSGFDSNTPGTKTITIEYGGLTSSFSVLVSERSEIVTEGSFAAGNAIARLGERVEIPVTVFKNTGIAGFKHTITFEASNLRFVEVAFAGAFANGSAVVNDEKDAQGEVSIVWYDGKDIANDGTVYTLVFEVLEEAQDGITEIGIAFNDNDNGNISGENVLFGAVNGSVEIRSYWLGDLNGDRLFRVADLLQLAQYVAGKKMTLTEKQRLSADVNEDSNIDIHDVILLQQWILKAGVQKSAEPVMLASVDDLMDPVEISLGEVTAVNGQEVIVPVTINNNTGISAFMFEVSYDADALTFIGAENGEALNKGTVVTRTDEQKQTITVLWYSADGDVKTDGEIVPLKFLTDDDAKGNYDLSVGYVAADILDEDYEKVECAMFDGKIEIISMENVDVVVVERTATTATLAVTNKTGEEIHAHLITTACDVNGKQLSCTMKQSIIEPQKPVTVTVEFSAEADSLKIFLLDPVSWKPSNFSKQLSVK